MKKPSKKAVLPATPQAAALRQRADAIFRENTAQFLEQPESQWPAEAQKILHELRVHQIELELQNAELREAQAATIAANARYFDFYDLAPVGYVTVSEQGLMLEANLTTATFLGLPRAQVLKQSLARFVHRENQDRYYMFCSRLLQTGAQQTCELQMIRQDGTPFAARLEAIAAQDAEGAPVLRLVLTDISARKLSDEDLHQSEERYRSLFASSLDPILLTAPDGSILAVNEATCRLLDRTEEEIISLGRNGIVDTSDKRLGAALDERNQTGLFKGEVTLLRKNGTKIPCEVSSAVFKDKYGNARTSMIVRDLTERKEAEAALRESEEKFAKIFRDAPVWIAISELESGTYLDVNEAALQASGFTREEVIGHTAVELGWLTAESRAQLVRKLQEQGPKASMEMVFRAKDGRLLHGLFNGEPIVIAGRACLLTVTVDLTERKQIEAALHVSETRNRETIEFAVDGILQGSLDGTIIGANSQMLKFSGRPLDKLLGLPMRDLFSPDELLAKPPLFDLLDQGMVVVNERNLLRPDGTTLPVEMHSKKMPDGTYQSIYRDITGRRQAEAALRESEERYQRITKAVTDYIYTVRVADGRAVETTHGPGCLAVTGYLAKDFAQDPYLWLHMVVAEDRPKVEEQARQILAGEDPAPLEHRLAHKSGQVRWVRNTFVPHRNERGVLVAYDGLIQDITDRKKAEDELRHVQSNLSALFESTNDLIWSVDLQHRMVTFNHQLVQHCRRSYSTEVRIGTIPKDFLPPERAARWGPLYERTLAEGPYRLEYGLTDGRSLELSFHPIVSGDEKIGVSVFGKDITEQKKSEELLRKSKQQYDNLAAQIPIGIYLLRSTPAGAFALDYASPKMAELFGTTVDRLRADAQIVIQSIHPEERDEFVRLNQQGIRFRQPFNWEGRVLIQGAVKWLQIASRSELQDSGDVLWFGIVKDITERKQAEAAMRESEASLRESQLIAGLGSYVLDIATGVWRSSDILDTMLGIDRAYPHTLENWAALIHHDDRAQMWDYFNRQVLGQSQSFNRQYRIIRQTDRAERWVHGLGRLEFDGQGRVLRMRGTIQDITERIQAEADKARLAAQNQQLQKAESLGRMAGAIAHHFNNQLHAVMMRLEMALSDLPAHLEPVESLNEAMVAARKAAEVSTQMLTYLGQSFDKTEALDFSEVCLRALNGLRDIMPRKMTLETNLPSPGPIIQGNANQIQQVLTNLVTNAWEASGDAGGTIRLTIKTVAAADIPATGRFPLDWRQQDTPYACLEVADTGCGIAARDIEKLFDPFFSSKFTGRGLGLAMVLGIVRSHRGAVTVESELGKHSLFRVFLPVTKNAPTTTTAPEIPRPARNRTVLVVENAPTMRSTVTLALELSDYTVLAAEDGTKAVQLFTGHQVEIDCVLCEATLPGGMDGWATLTALRRLAPTLPVIFVSDHGEAQVLAGDHPERPQAFLQKPYELSALKHALAKVLGRIA